MIFPCEKRKNAGMKEKKKSKKLKTKRTKEYFVQASRKSRLKRKQIEMNLEQTNAILTYDRKLLRRRIRALRSEIVLLTKEDSTLLRDFAYNRLSAENAFLKSELLKYKIATQSISTMLTKVEKIGHCHESMHIVNQNSFYLVSKLHKLALETAAQPSKVLKVYLKNFLTSRQRDAVYQLIENRFSVNESRMKISENFMEKTFENLKHEFRFGDTTLNSVMSSRWFRMDVLDFPISKGDFITAWEYLNNPSFLAKSVEAIVENGDTNFLESISLRFRKYQQPKIYNERFSNDSAKEDIIPQILKMSDNRYLPGKMFPLGAGLENELTNGLIDTIAEGKMKELEEIDNSGKSEFQGVLFRRGSQHNHTHFTAIFSLAKYDDDEGSNKIPKERSLSAYVEQKLLKTQLLLRGCLYTSLSQSWRN